MRRRFLILFLAVLPIALYAHAAVNPEYELDDPLANDAAALAYIQANFWDTNADGTGTAREGQCYYNTTDDTRRCYDGAGWIETDANTTVAGLAHTQGTDQGLDTGGANAVTAAQAKAASDHVSADGSSHTYIDQDVTSGSSPTLDGNNFTGVDADDVDLVTVPSGNCTGDTTADGCLATLDAASLGGGSVIKIDMGAGGDDHNWLTDGATDSTSGFVASSAYLNYDILRRVGGTGIEFDVNSADGALLTLNLTTGFTTLMNAGTTTVVMEISMVNMDGNGDNLFVGLRDLSTSSEFSFLKIDYNGANRRISHDVKRRSAWVGSQIANTANWNSANAFIFARRGIDEQQAGHVTAALVEPTVVVSDGWAFQDGDGCSVHVQLTGVGGGRLKGTIHNIWIGGVPATFTP